MKFKNHNDLLNAILEDTISVELKLKEGVTTYMFGDKNLPIIFYDGKEKWVKCEFKDYADFSPIKSTYKIRIEPTEENFKGKAYYFSDLFDILNMDQEEKTKIRVNEKGKYNENI